MCGIALIIDKNDNNVSPQLMESMTNKVQHRGPDGSGVFIDRNVGLGHRRLSIIDLSACGNQPMFYESLSIVFNGEIYNYIELREELKHFGYKFSSVSDTEVLLIAYHHWGKECVHRLRGMWAFVIYDKKEKIVFVSRDRFGIKPLHYTKTNTKFLAGSEIKQFSVVEDFEARMFHPVVYEFINNSVLNHNEYTFYKDVYSLQAGHNLIYSLKDNEYEVYQWYFIEKVPVKKKISPKESARSFRERFEEAVKIHLRSDVKLGSCLSGGLDSSSIVSMTRKILGNDASIYTITSCNVNASFDERDYAKEVVEHSHTQPIFTTPDLSSLYSENVLEKINYFQDQPILSGSHFSEYKVFEEAGKNKLIVMLDGQGSDEYLAGYHNFFLMRCKGLLMKGKFRQLHKTISERAQNRGLSLKGVYIELAKLLLRGPFNKIKPAKNKKYRWVRKSWAEEQRLSKASTFEKIKPAGNLHELSLMAIQNTSIPYQLHSEDRNSMIFSVESRVPFLDHVLVEAMLGLPEDNYYDYGLDKMPIRKGLNDILPSKISKRKTKLGFASSDEVWMKEHGEEVKERLAQALSYFKDILHPGILEEFDEYLAGNRNYDNIFFRVLSLYAWAKVSGVKL
jgi:asparagine synthase (glutamine-hydrolysing)